MVIPCTLLTPGRLIRILSPKRSRAKPMARPGRPAGGGRPHRRAAHRHDHGAHGTALEPGRRGGGDAHDGACDAHRAGRDPRAGRDHERLGADPRERRRDAPLGRLPECDRRHGRDPLQRRGERRLFRRPRCPRAAHQRRRNAPGERAGDRGRDAAEQQRRQSVRHQPAFLL